jgi:GNAT superfamily N-acetyltransferase
MTDFTIDELHVPSTLDAPGGADFARAVDLGNAVEALGYGTTELAYFPSEELAWYLDPYTPYRLLLARVGGSIAGRAIYETRADDEADTAWLTVQVLPEFRRRGIGTALADAVEAMASAAGKAKAVVYTVSGGGNGPRLAAPTGFGSVPQENDEVRFLLGRGYTLEQVERGSRLALPLAELDERLAAAEQASGQDYAVRLWTHRTPERWLEDMALLITRMSTDEPTAGLEQQEDAWSVGRLVETEVRQLATTPRIRLTAAIEHLPSATLVGFTDLSVPPEGERAVHQDATLVLSGHRGHRLGMLLKVANLAHLERVRPGHPSVVTWNAEENSHMLAVNEAVGFQPLGHEGAWKKALGG